MLNDFRVPVHDLSAGRRYAAALTAAGAHAAFTASRPEVDVFHAAARAAGEHDNRPPVKHPLLCHPLHWTRLAATSGQPPSAAVTKDR